VKRVYQVSRSRAPSPFRAESSVFFVGRRPPSHLRVSGSSSRTLRSSPECYHFRSALCPKAPSAFLGVAVPLRDVSQPRPCREPPTAHCLAVLGVSHAHDGFLRVWPCGFISPHCHVQGSLFRGLLLVRSRYAFQRPLPSRRCPDSARGSCPPPPLRRSSPSGLSSASESVTQSPGVSRLPSPFPS
jgi:hypothetical protein